MRIECVPCKNFLSDRKKRGKKSLKKNPVYTEQSPDSNNMYLSGQKSNNPNFVSKLGLLGGAVDGT